MASLLNIMIGRLYLKTLGNKKLEPAPDLNPSDMPALLMQKYEIDQKIYDQILATQKDNIHTREKYALVLEENIRYKNCLKSIDDWMADLLPQNSSMITLDAWADEVQWMREDIQKTLAGQDID